MVAHLAAQAQLDPYSGTIVARARQQPAAVQHRHVQAAVARRHLPRGARSHSRHGLRARELAGLDRPHAVAAQCPRIAGVGLQAQPQRGVLRRRALLPLLDRAQSSRRRPLRVMRL
jgi:hypothetical protein